MCSSRNFANSGNCSVCDFTDVSTIRPRTAPIHLAKARYSSTLSPVMCFIFKMERLQTIDSTLMSRAMTARRRASLESFMSEMFGSLASRSICAISGPTVSLQSCIAAFPAVSNANYSEIRSDHLNRLLRRTASRDWKRGRRLCRQPCARLVSY